MVRVPPWTPSESVVFVSGDRRELGRWRPDAVKLRRQGDGTWRGTVRMEPGTPFHWKVTLGRWDCAERDASGADMANRFGVAGERALAEVCGWGRQACRPSTIVGELHAHERFYAHALGNLRTLWVWLPPGYGHVAAAGGPEIGTENGIKNSTDGTENFAAHRGEGGAANGRKGGGLSGKGTEGGRSEGGDDEGADFSGDVSGSAKGSSSAVATGPRYPVVYMHDGQNLFDAARASFGVEWGVDEAMTAGISEATVRPAIVVGIENSPDRFGEYTPTAAGGIGGRGAQYAKFLLDDVKPFIDSRYRTLPSPEHTFTAGSSLGGLISLYLLAEHPDVFGGCAGVSPSLWWDAETFLKGAERDARWAAGKRIWIDTGTHEQGWGDQDAHIARTLRLQQALEREAPHLRCEIVDGADHSEAAWSQRIRRILEHLLGGP